MTFLTLDKLRACAKMFPSFDLVDQYLYRNWKANKFFFLLLVNFFLMFYDILKSLVALK